MSIMINTNVANDTNPNVTKNNDTNVTNDTNTNVTMFRVYLGLKLGFRLWLRFRVYV